MREIKFRARNAELPRCWVYGYFVIQLGVCYIINQDGKFKVIADTEGQYTGLKDKKGVEIYKGDIVKCSKCVGAIYEIKWNDYHCGWGFIKPEVEGFEIIGNIYEHRELLNESIN